MKGVVRVLRHLRHRNRHLEDGRIEVAVQRCQGSTGTRHALADDDLRRREVVLDGTALAQELRVVDGLEALARRPRLALQGRHDDLFQRTGQHRRAVDDRKLQGVRWPQGNRAGDLLRHR